MFSTIILLTIQLNAQFVDESINGILAGFLGLWLHNESKIALKWALRTEVGYEAPFTTGIGSGGFEACVFSPVVSLETRWYYNSPKRQGNSKNHFHNSSNHASLILR